MIFKYILLAIVLIGAAFLILSACDAMDKPPSVLDPMAYLAQSKNPDGNTATPLTSTDPLTYRRTDIGGYQIEDSFLTSHIRAITTWSYPPFGPFVKENGDGGEEYILERDTVRISSTQHGGYPIGYFVGKNCGGTGWLVFKTDATNEWKDVIAKLGISLNPLECKATSKAYTRYKIATVNYPQIGPVETMISEHYDRGGMVESEALERFFLGRGWGRLVWQAFASNREPSPDIATRCPDFGWNIPPTPTLKLVDCRVVTNIIPADGSLTGTQVWHP